MAETLSLQDVFLFQGQSPEQVENLKKISTKINLPAKREIFVQGDPASGFYLILSGRVKVYKLSPEGREQILHIFTSGEPIGEVPVFSGGTFPASAETLEPCTLLFFPRDRLRSLFSGDPSMAMNMLAVLAGRLREFTRTIENLSLKNLTSRLASYLMHTHSPKQGTVIELGIPKGVLANILGTSQEALSRTFRRMSEAGIIKVNGRSIEILDPERLSRIAEALEELA
ncbi:MAG: Crp/Fnr family transcriptional regulator [Thermodesulfobacteriota bacterium]